LCILFEGWNDLLHAAYASGSYSEQLRENAIGMGKGITGWVVAHKRPMLNTDPALDFFRLQE